MTFFPRFRHGSSDPSLDRWKDAFHAAARVNELASSAAALPEAVSSVVRTALGLLGAQQSSIMLLDPRGSHLELIAIAGEPPGVQVGHRTPVGEGIAGRVVATGRALRVEDVDGSTFVNFVPKTKAIASSIVAPLRAGGRCIGVLNVATSDPHLSYDDEDLRIAQLFADVAAGLIHRTRLHEQAERRSADLSALLAASEELLGILSTEPLLQAVLDGAADLLGVSRGFVCLMEPTEKQVTSGVFRGFDKDSIRGLMGHGQIQQVVETTGLTLLEEQGLVAVGLKTSQGTRGLIVLAADAPTASERASLLQAFAQQCAAAIGSTELFAMMERKESELASIIQSVPNPIVLTDAKKRIVTLNPAAEHLFGLSSAFSTGAPITGAFDQGEVADLLLGDGDITAEVAIGAPPRTFKARVADVRMPGVPVGRLLVMDDVTTEREMVQTQHDFVAMIGHELRTPLTVIKGFTRMLLKRMAKGSLDDIAEPLSVIDAKAAQLERLIEDLLYVSRIESREAVLKVEEVDVRALIQQVSGEVLKDHPDRVVDVDAPAQLVWACDETKVSLVLRHLIENSLKYSEAPEPVVVRVQVHQEALQLDVVDRGVGIVSSDVPHLFERFRQLDGSSTREHGGTGVGLYLCAQLVRVLEGRIWVDSAWGKGSTFSFMLPRRSVRNAVVSIQGRSAVV